MGFTSGAKVSADLIDSIANGLIGSSVNWSDNDVTWNTSVRTGNLARRSLIYTGDTTDIYIAIEVINTQTPFVYYYNGNNNVWVYGKGIRIVITSSWDSVNHTYPAGGMATFVPFEAHSTTIAADMETLQITYYMWLDANGFVIMGVPEPTTDGYQQAFKISLERVAAKEYADGYSNFFLHAACNIWPHFYDTSNVVDYNRNRGYIRFPAFYYPTNDNNTTAVWNNGITLAPITQHAFKSEGNGKVYYVKPVYHNDVLCRTPIAQAESWFYWNTDVGLVDGDIVAIDGATTKYLCKGLQSPDSINRLTYAIKYVA